MGLGEHCPHPSLTGAMLRENLDCNTAAPSLNFLYLSNVTPSHPPMMHHIARDVIYSAMADIFQIQIDFFNDKKQVFETMQIFLHCLIF